MEHDEIPEPTLPAGWRKRPVWAWLAMSGGVALIAILTATGIELALRPLATEVSESAGAAPASPPPDIDLLATVPATPSAPGAIVSPLPALIPAPLATEAAPARPLDATPPQSARVPMRTPPVARPAPPTMGRGRDG